MNKNTNKKKNTETVSISDYIANKSMATLIRHFMAEKGCDSEQFDKELTEQLNKYVEKMYRKYVPAEVRKLNNIFDFSKKKNSAVPAQADTKESVENDTDDELGNS